MTITIATPRLTLRPTGIRYLNEIHPYTSDPENTRFMTNLPNDSIDDCAAFLRAADAEWTKDAPDFYEFAVLLGETVIGGVSVHPDENDRTCAELGWSFNKAHWGNGYATEAARALVEYAHANLGVNRFIAHCDSENIGSYRVMEKLGMRRTGYWRGRKNKLSDEDRGEFQYELTLPAHRTMRRKERQLPDETALDILRDCEYGVLSTVGADGYPYGVPVNHVLIDNAIYIHAALKGHKIDNIRHCGKVAFNAVRTAEVLPEEFSTAYESATAFGTATLVEDADEMLRALVALVEKYAPARMEYGEAHARKMLPATAIIRIDVLRLTAKQRKKA